MKKNRQQRLDEVFRKDYSWLTNKLRYRTGDPDKAADIASESFVQFAAVRELDSVREPRAMLTTIANRVFFNTLRRRSLYQNYLQLLAQMPTTIEVSAEDQNAMMDALLAVDRAFDTLPEKARQAFVYCRLEGLTQAEAAAKIGVSKSMVRQYIAAVQTRLEEVVQNP
ncbi:sigma-70 family RNA polymerase sigma factor [Salinisphaera sp. Q1T1-3]|uniref:sigma-70 family RNA polymerase sigma factor n=1 Tax=Salinisphaera sp. Q1T1-3 TaxID=2321229 RepID=UPI000E741455|nr:sigma-70 family RNA polymerase sigma factor [Salinisphaera sp. Q1T1-3]RJS93728.1 sigma-70 family RNA polymerase sigma factor [Salinisphaera sp. Q1T1-3]